MSKLTFALFAAATVGLIAASQPSVAQQPSPKRVTSSLVRGEHICSFRCPAGTNVCPSDDINPRTGCPVFYRCVKGRPGSDACP